MPSPLSALIVVDYPPFVEDFNGATKIQYNVIKRISERCNVDLLIVTSEPCEVLDVFPNVQKVYLEVKTPKTPNYFKFFPFPSYSRNFQSQLIDKYGIDQYNVVHIYAMSLMGLANLIQPLTILGIDDSFSFSLKRKISLSYCLKYLFWRIVEIKISRLNARLTFVSDLDATQYPTKNKIVLPNGIDTSKYISRINFHEKIPNSFVFHGVLDFGPNMDAYHLGEQWITYLGPEWHYYLVGRMTRPQSSLLIDEIANSPTFKYIGPVADVAAEITKYSFYLCLMESGAGIKNKLLEALSCGCVVFANEKAIEGLLGRVELLTCIFLVDTKEQFKKLVLDTKTEEFQVKANNARKYVQKYYSWEKYVDSLFECYQNQLPS